VPEILKTVGRYEILREVGRGGMAMVYLARQTDLDRFVALKELAAFHASDAAFAQRFLRESRVAGSLSHPNIVTVHDYFEHDGTPYIAMEYVERGSLRPFIGEMSLAQIGGVLEGLLAGLALAEQHAIVHRDLKPENLMVTSDGRVKIADFGIAKATNQMQTGAFLTATGTTVGTPTYMAPEQAMAQDIGPWTDLYSVGCMAFEMFTGKVPFHDSDAPMAILLRHVNEPIPPVKSIEDSVDAGISDWVERLLVKDPKERTQSANEAWDDFEELIIGILGPRWRRAARLSPAGGRDTPAPLTPIGLQPAPTSDDVDWGDRPAAGTPGPATPPPENMPPGPMESDVIEVPSTPPAPAPASPAGESGFVTFGAPPPVDEPAPDVADEPAPDVADEPPAAPERVVDEATGFVTFGAPAPPVEPPPPAEPPAAPAAPADEVAAPGVEPPAPAAPADEVAAPADSAAPPADAAAPVGEPAAPTEEPPAAGDEDAGFNTYVAPPPARPPTHEPPAREAPAPAAQPQAPEPVEVTPPPADVAPEPEPEPVQPEPEPVEPEPEPEPAAVAPVPAVPLGATEMPQALMREPKAREKAPAERRERSSKAFPIVLGGGLVAAIVVGVLLGGGGGGGSDDGGGEAPNPSTPVTAVEGGALQVKVPAGYAPLASVPAIAGLELADGAAFAPGGTDGGRAVAIGRAVAPDSTLLPPTFRGAVGLETGEVPDRTAVRLGPDDLEAYRYEGLQPTDADRQLTVYASPTSEGVATVACLAPPADAAAFKGECEAIADTLQVSAGRPFGVGADPAYAKTLGQTFGRLEGQVEKGRGALTRDKATFRGQAAAARDIQAAYTAAAKRLRTAEISPADQAINAVLVRGLRRSAAAWKQAERAAARKDKRGFARSEAAIKRARRELSQSFAQLEQLGYELGR
jgi:serine/threonine protein kinase